MATPDVVRELVRDYDAATKLEEIATRPEDKIKFLKMRNFIYLVLAELLRETVWH